MSIATNALTIVEAAAQLGLSPRQLRYAVRQGAPVVRRGSKGHGNATFVNPTEVRRWLDTRDQTDAQHRKLADKLIRAVADNTVLQFRAQTGPHKAALLTNLIIGFYATADAIRRQLGLPPVDPADVPATIQQMDTANVHLNRFGNLAAVPTWSNQRE